MTKRNACDYWMGDVSISNGFGEWTGPAIPTILNNWFHLRLEWPLCEYLHRDNGLSHSDEWDVWHKEYSSTSQWSFEVALKSADVYSWQRDEMSTSSDCDVILVLECIWKNHIGEIGHVYISFRRRWESLSITMWRGQRNVLLLLPVAVSDLSLGKSSQSIHSQSSTSHYQCAWSIISDYACITTHLNGFQFRQV